MDVNYNPPCGEAERIRLLATGKWNILSKSLYITMFNGVMDVMKKHLILIGMSITLFLGVGIGAYAASDIRLFVHGQQIDADVQMINGSSYVPLRVVSEALGAQVNWDEGTRTISIKNTKAYEVNASVWSGSLLMQISNITLDTAYQNNKTTDPIHAIIFDVTITNTSNSKISWFPTKGKISLNNDQIVPITDQTAFSDDLDGLYARQQVKKGKIVVKVDSNLDTIRTVNFLLDGATDGNQYAPVDARPIDLK